MMRRNSNTPEISVLMSVYNASKWLPQSIESILCQSFSNFEFIIIDDGSTDDSLKVIEGYSLRDKRIKVFHKKNTGLTDSLNFGLSKSKGKYVARIDADDFSEIDRLEKQYAFMEKHKDTVLIGTCFYEIDGRDNIVKNHRLPKIHKKLLKNLERYGKFMPHSSLFFKKSASEKIGNYNDKFIKSQDWDLSLRLSEKGKIFCIREPLVRIRKHSDQISNSKNGFSQPVYAFSSTICHFLRLTENFDPSQASDDQNWKQFTDWVHNRMIEEGFFHRRQIWSEIRRDIFYFRKNLVGLIKTFGKFILSESSGKIFMEKISGSSLPEKFAKEWIKLHSLAKG